MASFSEIPWLDSKVQEYCAARATPQPDPVLQELARVTEERFGRAAVMQIGGDQGALMGLLVALTGARRAVEVGTFTGYSSLCIARALPEDGRLLCCDVSEEWTSLAREAWTKAGVDHKIVLAIAPAIETLEALPADEVIDVAFIDADKPSYLAYYEELLPRLRTNGLLMVDNTLWSGKVLDPDANDDDTTALKAFNDYVAADRRVHSVLLPIRDGLTLIRKR
jgi:caffeoyl-CoA O-methyltransferase